MADVIWKTGEPQPCPGAWTPCPGGYRLVGTPEEEAKRAKKPAKKKPKG